MRHACSRIPVLCIGCFNPRTHTGCDFAPFASGDYAIVSIHAPTRGATSSLLQPVRRSDGFQSTHPHGVRLGGCRGAIINKKVSIHAPTRGATGITLWSKTIVSYCFNPRTHTGCDRAVGSPPVDEVLVSIHAPTRGATRNITGWWTGLPGFNPRTHTGCDNLRAGLAHG